MLEIRNSVKDCLTIKDIVRKTNAEDAPRPKWSTRQPLEVRKAEYEEARARIFAEDGDACRSTEGSFPKKRKAHALRRKERRSVCEALGSVLKNDDRAFAEVQIQGHTVKGLLDTGATVSLLGTGAVELIEELGLAWHPQTSKVRAAGGASYTVLGKVSVSIRYNNMTRQMKLYVCPALGQRLYLGIDFWRKFRLAPDVIGVEAVEPMDSEFVTKGEPVEPHRLNSEQQEQLKGVKAKFLAYEERGLGQTRLEQHTIELVKGTVPVKERFYPVSPAVQQLLFAEVDEMLRLGVIEPSESPWSNRMTLVRKPGKNRLCLDARKLNEVTVKDAYPLQNIESILSRVDDTIYISSVDLKHAFWQIELEPNSRAFTAFTIPGRPLYQFRMMPFGLCNAAQRLCRLMDRVIPQRLRNRVFVYLDDLLIISRTFDEHMELLEDVAQCLEKANLTIGLQKSKFCFRFLRYLGYIIGEGALRTDPSKIEAIIQVPIPRTAKQLRRFLGTAGWYRRFIRDFSSLSAPLTDCLKINKKFEMSAEAEEAFQALKMALTSAPVLVHPDFRRPYFIQCDASHVGIGAVLFQRDDEGADRPIAFFSAKLRGAQLNYSVTEKECLAAVKAVERFRPYVELMPFTVITDHSSLQWLMSLKDLSGRLARWSLALQSFDFTIEHREGKDNVVADMLSRPFDVEELDIFEFETTAFESEEYMERLALVRAEAERFPDLWIEDGLLFKRSQFAREDSEEFLWKLWVPEALTNTLVRQAHDGDQGMHGGIARTLARLRQFYFWPRMAAQVRSYVLECDKCKEAKHSTQGGRPKMGSEVVTERPMQKLYIDFLGKYPRSRQGNAYVLVVLDHFSKFVWLKAIPKATSAVVMRFLREEVLTVFGVPEIIHTDNGKQFVAHDFEAMLEQYGIKHVRTANYSPQSNASERVNQSVLAAIRVNIGSDQTTWDEKLPEIAMALRSAVHSATGTSPYFAVFGQHMLSNGCEYRLARKLGDVDGAWINPVERSVKQGIYRAQVQETLHRAYEKSAKQYNLKARDVQFAAGQEVFKRNFVLSDFAKNLNAKFCRRYTKCRVVRPVGQCLYELETLQGNPLGVFHAKDIKQ